MNKLTILTIAAGVISTLGGVIWHGVVSDVEAHNVTIPKLEQKIDVNATRIDATERQLNRIEDKLDIMVDHELNEHGGINRISPEERRRLLERPAR